MAPERQYILDCAVELGEVTPLEAHVFCANTPAARALDEILDQDGHMPPHFLRNTARAYLNQVSSQERMVWALRTVQDVPMALKFLRERIEFVVKTKALTDLGVRERLDAPWLAELSTQGASSSAPVFTSFDDVAQPTIARYVQAEYGSVLAMIEEDLALASDALAWLSRPGARESAKKIARRLFEEPTHLPAVNRVRKQQVLKPQKRHIRGAIKKGLALLASFGRQKEVSLLVSGQRAVLSHPDSPFKLELVPYSAGWLEDRTMRPGATAPFEIHLLTKEDVHLSRLCVLFEETPVLDQLLALSLYVDTGNEMELFHKANWFGVRDAEVVRAVLQDKAPALLPKVETVKAQANVADLVRISAQENFEDEAWAAYQGPVSQWVGFCLDNLQRQAKQLCQTFCAAPAISNKQPCLA